MNKSSSFFWLLVNHPEELELLSQGAESPRASSAALHLVWATTSLAFTGSLKRMIFTAIAIFRASCATEYFKLMQTQT